MRLHQRILLGIGILGIQILTSFYTVASPSASYEVLQGPDIALIYKPYYTEQALNALEDGENILKTYREDFAVTHEYYWPLIISDEASRSNGYVTFPNIYTRWEMTPDGFMGNENYWLHLLALHETRHMVQNEALTTGISSWLYKLGGPQLLTNLELLYIPKWMKEGDAVLAETIYSYEGRGRSADFERQFKALVLENPKLSWYKLVNGSYKNFYPNHYVYGYFMMSYIARELGLEAEQKLFSTMGKYPIPYASPNIALWKAFSKFTTEATLFKRVTAELREIWEKQLEEKTLTTQNTVFVPDQKNFYTLFQADIDGDTITIVQYDYENYITLRTYSLATGEPVEKVRKISSEKAGIGSTKVAFIEHRARGESLNNTFGTLVVYDRESGRFSDLAKGTFTGSPVISPDGTEVAVVSFSPETGEHLEIYSIKGVLQKKIIPQKGAYISTFDWGQQSEIVAGITHPTGTFLCTYSTDTGAETVLTGIPGIVSGIAAATENPEDIAFCSDVSGTQEIYLYSLHNDSVRQVTSSRYGIWAPFFADGKLYATEQLTGLQEAVVEIPLHQHQTITPGNYRTEYLAELYEPDRIPTSLSHSELAEDDARTRFDEYQKAPYTSLLFLGQPSAAGILIPYQPSELSAGFRTSDPFTLYTGEASLSWNFDEDNLVPRIILQRDTHKLSLSLSGAAWIDPLQSGFDAVGLESTLNLVYTSQLSQYGHSRYQQAGTSLTAQNSQMSTIPYFGSVYHILGYGLTNGKQGLGAFELGFSQFTRLSFSPEFDSLVNSPYSIISNTTGYLPGPFAGDTFLLTHNFQWNPTQRYSWSVTNVRGNDAPVSDSVSVDDQFIGQLSCTYKVPLLYPDLSLLWVSYFKRLYANIYVDMLYAYSGIHTSAGIDLVSQFNLFNDPAFMVSIGVRGAVLLDSMTPVLTYIIKM